MKREPKLDSNNQGIIKKHQLLSLQWTPSSALPAGKPESRINKSRCDLGGVTQKVVGYGAASVLVLLVLLVLLVVVVGVVLVSTATGALLFPGPGTSERQRWLLPQDIL